MATFHSWIMEGMAQRFEGLRIGFIEAGCGWLPYMLADIRRRHEMMGREAPDDLLAAHRIWVTGETHEDLAYVVEQVGPDSLMVGTDYGHSDVTSQIAALTRLRRDCGLAPEAVDKMLDANPARLYGLAGNA